MKFLIAFVALVGLTAARPSATPSPVVIEHGPGVSTATNALVQIILNIQQEAGSTVPPVSVIGPQPVKPEPVKPEPVRPEPVQVVETAPIVPEPVIIGTPQLPVLPEPVVIGTPQLPVVVEPVVIGTPIIPSPAVVLPEELN